MKQSQIPANVSVFVIIFICIFMLGFLIRIIVKPQEKSAGLTNHHICH